MTEKIAIYVHWPYCARICPYCDFNIYKNKPQNEDELISAIIRDLQNWHKESGQRKLVSIHFGGGTPSLMSAKSVAKIINCAKSLWAVSGNIEIGLEANPNDINKKNLIGWREAGIERLSLGVQSFNDKALKLLGRNHNGQMAKNALIKSAQIMRRVSADIIFGQAGQSIDELEQDLQVLLTNNIGHISTYQLTIEENTAFGRAAARGNVKSVTSDKSADLFEFVIDRLAKSGFEQYEISNFAKGDDNYSRHNLIYWQGGDYIGLGPGAHGRIIINGKKYARIAQPKPDDYIKSICNNNTGFLENKLMNNQDIATEYVLMGLRIKQGICLEHYRSIAGKELSAKIIAEFIDYGLLQQQGSRIYATPKGRLVLDTISEQLLLS